MTEKRKRRTPSEIAAEKEMQTFTIQMVVDVKARGLLDLLKIIESLNAEAARLGKASMKVELNGQTIPL
jgi:hypothetical protein